MMLLSVLRNGWNQTDRTIFLRSTVFAVLAAWCYFDASEVVLAQQNPRSVTYQTTNQTVTPARQVAVAEPMKPVPDFWAIHSDNLEMLTAHDRLDRRNLPMFYHFSYDQFHRANLPVVPNPATMPEPQHQNSPNDLDARLQKLKESTNGGTRTVTPPTPPPNDSQQPAAVKIRKLPGIQGIVATDSF